MSENKTIDDFEEEAYFLLSAILSKSVKYQTYGGSLTINFSDSVNIIKSHLLDKWNDGYDFAIVNQKPRYWRDS